MIRNYRRACVRVGVAALLAAALCGVNGARADVKAVAWNGTDTQGHAVGVPAQNPTLLLFLRVDQSQSSDEITQLQGALKDRKDLQVVAVVSGDDAESNAGKLAAKCSWPVVADGNYVASGK